MVHAILIMILSIVVVGCTSNPGKELEDRRSDQQKAAEDHKFKAVYLGYPSFYLLEFEGHEYLTRGGSSPILHSESCPGRHGLHGE